MKVGTQEPFEFKPVIVVLNIKSIECHDSHSIVFLALLSFRLFLVKFGMFIKDLIDKAITVVVKLGLSHVKRRHATPPCCPPIFDERVGVHQEIMSIKF